jgi:hypothetical protein
MTVPPVPRDIVAQAVPAQRADLFPRVKGASCGNGCYGAPSSGAR